MPYNKEERRKYIRLNSCFPVEFSLIFSGIKASDKKYQAFTRDVSKGGLCIKVKGLTGQDLEALVSKRVRLEVSIDMLSPLFKQPVCAFCSVAWIEPMEQSSAEGLYSIGISYEKIYPRDKSKIFNYAIRLKWAPRITAAIVILLSGALLFAHFNQINMSRQNRRLVARLVETSEKSNNVYKRLNALAQEKLLLQKKLAQAQDTVENSQLQTQIQSVVKGEELLQKELTDIGFESAALQFATTQKMLDWVCTHQNRRSGLVMSYEGDKAFLDWSFTYDQALAAQVFMLSGDIKKAASILDFYKNKAKKENALFYNAYDCQSGKPVETTVHSGPNLWIAIAACKFLKYANDASYLGLARDIADKMIAMQKASDDASIKGGPKVGWVSTEHNMDAYALFNMLYELTKEEKYKTARDAALGWLKQSAYNRPQGRFNRGKGDATIATDTFSWAIASVGPQALKENGMDPDAIMEFAQKECKVQAQFYRPDEKCVDVVGFDFAKPANIGRGGIVSCEWTAQMIVAYKIMANYHQSRGNRERAAEYAKEAKYYLMELDKMVISSPSPSGQGEGCLPYASIDNVDTGHGWRVAKGGNTGSVAATIYYIFAQRGYNPLKL
ncbi:MAG: PilZ domain-containing protein [Candidatus Omnitrophota bacterium]